MCVRACVKQYRGVRVRVRDVRVFVYVRVGYMVVISVFDVMHV